MITVGLSYRWQGSPLPCPEGQRAFMDGKLRICLKERAINGKVYHEFEGVPGFWNYYKFESRIQRFERAMEAQIPSHSPLPILRQSPRVEEVIKPSNTSVSLAPEPKMRVISDPEVIVKI